MSIRLFLTLFILCILALTIGCKKDDNTPATSLTAGPSIFNVSAEAGNSVFNIVSNQSWTITSDQSWLTLSTNSGANDGIITLTYPKNEGLARVAHVTIKGGNATATVTVNQAVGLTATATTTIDPLGAGKGTFTISVVAVMPWKLDITDTTWLKSSITSGPAGTSTITLQNRLNYSAGSRSASLRFMNLNNDLLQTLSVNQANNSQANLLLDKRWAVYREIKTNMTTGLVTDKIISDPCELDDWVVLREDSVTLYQGPVPCSSPKPNDVVPVVYNAAFTTVSLTSNGQTDAYNILKLTGDSLIIENIPPYIDNTKAKRILYRKP